MNNELTKFTLFKNTPLNNFQNTIFFESNEERDNFFLNGGHYESIDFDNKPFNFVRDRSTIDLPLTLEESKGINYCSFISDLEPKIRYYAYVLQIEYINDHTTRFYLLIDGIMTFCQGTVLNSLNNLKIQRQHLTKPKYEENLWYLKNNDDILKTYTKSYFYEKQYKLNDFYVMIHSSADLSTDFGNVDDPKINTSDGGTFDKMTSPVNIYILDQSLFKRFMGQMSKFPWITQNFKKILMIPKEFIPADELENVTMKSINFTELKKLKNNGRSKRRETIEELTFSMNKLYEIFDLDPENDKHLLRNEYTTSEVYTFNGQGLFIDNGQLNQEKGLTMTYVSVVGSENIIAFFPLYYRINDKNMKSTYNNTRGGFLNDSIFLDNFDEIPILIDSFNLALAKNANQRRLTESKLITNRLNNILDSSGDPKERFFDSASILANVSIAGIGSRFVDEYEYYRQQQAEQADLALNVGTITNQNTTNALSIANDYFGLTLKFSKPDKQELNKIKKYYKMFGYYVPEENAQLDNVFSMTIANYVQFGGDWYIEGVEPSIMEQIKALFENGVRLWHNNNTSNPMKQDILNNKMRW